MSKRESRQAEQLTLIKKNSKCHFCGCSKNDYLSYGPIYKLGEIKAHYFCVLLSNRLIQNGKDDEGILGFLLSDIQQELQRTRAKLCVYCRKGKATITCAAKKCRRSFHLPCGLKRGSSHQFVKQFKSFCHSHRLVQNIPWKILREAHRMEPVCCICHEEVNVRDRSNILWAPCCLKTWYHRDCVQKLAYNAGYFCRCAACNNVKKFNECVQRFGIFIPQQDASWELVPNAFEELLFRYNKCDADVCKCPAGRQSNKEYTLWEVVVCGSCGSQGIHIGCGNLKFCDPEWECPDCRKVTSATTSASGVSSTSVREGEGSSKQSKLPEVHRKRRRKSSEDLENSVLDKRKKRRTNAEEEMEIDVETLDEVAKNDETLKEEAADDTRNAKENRYSEMEKTKTAHGSDAQVFAHIKPGPLSYKLALVRELMVPDPKEVKKRTESKASGSLTADVIELSDSEDSEKDGGVEVIEDGRGKSLRSDHRKTIEEAVVATLSADELEVMVVVSPRSEPEAGGSPPAPPETEPRNYIDRPIYFSAPVKTFHVFPEAEVPAFDSKLRKTASNEVIELAQTSEDAAVVVID